MNAEALLMDVSPYARTAARRTYFKYGIEEDDTYQQIMLVCWQEILKGFEADEPIAWLRKQISFAVGHIVQNRFWRKGNGVTDQMEDGFDVAAPEPRGDILLAKSLTDRLMKLSYKSVKSFHDVYLLGLNRADVAQSFGITPVGLQHHLDKALDAACDEAGVERRSRRKMGIDNNVYLFKHEDGRELRMSRKDFANETGSSSGHVGSMLSGKLNHCKGWRVVR